MEEKNQVQKAPQTTAVSFNLLDPASFDTCQRICTMYANSELVPDIYKISEKNPKEKAIANCIIALEMAQRTGAGILPIMQNMVVIYGKPTFSSTFCIASVNACGKYKNLKFRFKELGMLGKFDYTEYEKTWETGANGRRYQKTTEVKKTFDGTKVMNIECTAWTTENGSDEILEGSPVSVRMAIDEGWYTKAGSKWPNMTRQMLMYRAASFWTKTYEPGLLMGMQTTEEARDIEDAVIVSEIPTEERVRQEREQFAGKTQIQVDPETGEILNQAETGTPATEPAPEPEAPAPENRKENPTNEPNPPF